MSNKVKDLRDELEQAMEIRRQEIRRMYEEDGLSCGEIGRKMGLTRGRVHQIINELPPEDRPTKRR